MSGLSITVKDAFGTYSIGYDDVVKYHGRRFIAGAAIGFQCLALALAELSPGEPAERAKIRFFSGMAGLGVRDAVEMVTRCVTAGRYVADTAVVKDDNAPSTPGTGRFYYEVSYGTRTMRVRLKHGLVPDEFAPLALKDGAGTITADELRRLQEIKEGIAAHVTSRDPREIFDCETC